MFREVTVLLFYDGEYIQKLLFSKKKLEDLKFRPCSSGMRSHPRSIVKPYTFYLWNCLSMNYLSSHPVSTAYCAYNNEVINYHSAEDNTKTGDWKTEKENIKILLMKYSLKKT
jgi:hypothetical protein